MDNLALKNGNPFQKHPKARLRLLLAEDSREVAELIRIQLESSGIQVDFAFDGLEAIEKAFQKNYDLILMDVEMPLCDGLQAARRLRQRGLQTPVIALSAHGTDLDREKSLAAGCNYHAVKPCSQQELLGYIEQVLHFHTSLISRVEQNNQDSESGSQTHPVG